MPFGKTITLLPGIKLRGVPRKDIVFAIIEAFKPVKIVSVQFGFDNIRVVFEKEADTTFALKNYVVSLCGKQIKVDGGGSPILTAVLFDYPFEGPEKPIIDALSQYGEFKSARFQKYPYEEVSI